MTQGNAASFSVPFDGGLSGATRVYFIVGDPIAQVRSPADVTAALRAAGRDAVVVPAHVQAVHLPAFFACVTQMHNVDGVIITVPHKFNAARYCAGLTDEAKFLSAVNTLRRQADGSWYGGMFDGTGLVAALGDAGCDLRGQRALLVGAGGAGSAIGLAVLNAGAASLALHDNDPTRSAALVSNLSALFPGKVRVAAPDVGLETYHVVVNASPAGMHADDPLPVDVSRLPGTTFVGDVVTKPPLTSLIEAARTRGCVTVTGTQMFSRVCDRMVQFLLDAPAQHSQ
jgi:shikimate dehydrogenase